MTNHPLKDKIILALDSTDLAQALEWVRNLTPYVGYFKVGLEILSAHGAPKICAAIHRMGGKVFFDGKFNDIPNTIRGATKAITALGIEMFDIHASSGKKAMQEAVANKGNSIALAVTVLTSLDKKGSLEIFGKLPCTKVVHFAKMAASSGMDGIVCSPWELEVLSSDRRLSKLLKVTPGIRPAWAKKGDQTRTLEPREALQKGATHLVIGRPITAPPKKIGNSTSAIKRILSEIEGVSK